MHAKSRKPAVNRSKSTKQSGAPEYTAEAVLAQLKKLGDKRVREQMGTRFGITGPTAQKSFGVSMAKMKALAKKIGRSHDLALALWETGWYEARMMASLVDEPQRVTPAQMDKWCRAFDNWGICDTVCFCLFDRSPHAMSKIKKWA
ncbi:MAG: DNA alkylation repair protein, partial [Planctomycetes bacterium]|nr:DNA alkylation repair protein [Planctomycetota bacterium]